MSERCCRWKEKIGFRECSFLYIRRIHCPPHSTMSKEDLQVVVDLISCLFVQLIYNHAFLWSTFICACPTNTQKRRTRYFVQSLALEVHRRTYKCKLRGAVSIFVNVLLGSCKKTKRSHVRCNKIDTTAPVIEC